MYEFGKVVDDGQTDKRLKKFEKKTAGIKHYKVKDERPGHNGKTQLTLAKQKKKAKKVVKFITI